VPSLDPDSPEDVPEEDSEESEDDPVESPDGDSVDESDDVVVSDEPVESADSEDPGFAVLEDSPLDSDDFGVSGNFHIINHTPTILL
jgi:hypothetical protein